MREEIPDFMQARQKVTNKENIEHKNIDEQIKTKFKQVEETWINEECEDIESLERTNMALMHRK